jgi:predicted phosphoribosyltransferase
MVNLPFQDRTEAGRLLGAELAARTVGPNPIVLALPRGGVPVGLGAAEALHAPLDILVVRKLGVPGQPELAMGAIAGETRVLDYRIIRGLGISYDSLQAVISRETKEMMRREMLYRGCAPEPDLRGRTVVLVDDGLATGSTMVAAARQVRSLHAQKVIVAVPVGSSAACSRLRQEADACVCLAMPEPLSAVGEWYADFRQITDEEVREILEHAHASVPSGR